MTAQILPFRSRQQLLHVRGMRRYGRWVMKTKGWIPSDGPEASQWSDEAFAERKTDAEWAKRHGPVEGGAWVAQFPSPDAWRSSGRTKRARKKASR